MEVDTALETAAVVAARDAAETYAVLGAAADVAARDVAETYAVLG